MTSLASAGPQWLDDKLQAGELVVIDGAMGTELQARGVPMHKSAWSGEALLTHPEVVRQAHIDYIGAGAEVIIANTFATGRAILTDAGLADQHANLNRSAVEVALQARDDAATKPVAVAGSICDWRAEGSQWNDSAVIGAAMREQAEILAESGVDLIAVEMCSHKIITPVAVESALSVGLPVWAGLSCIRNDDDELVGLDRARHDFDEVVRAVVAHPVGLVNIMHSSVTETPAGLANVKRHWRGPLGAYPESGGFVAPNWEFGDIIEPDHLVREARSWVADGVQVLGGCCGLGPAHIKALREAFG